MGWASGSELLLKIVQSLQEHVADDNVREDIYIDIIQAFENLDCDTIYEVLGEDEAFDAAYHLVAEDDEDDFKPIADEEDDDDIE